MIIRRITAVAGAAVLLLGVSAAPALASVHTDGASVSFVVYGDRFHVCDTRSDGHGAYGEWKLINGKTHKTRLVGSGSGTCVWTNVNIPEHRYIKFRACEKIAHWGTSAPIGRSVTPA